MKKEDKIAGMDINEWIDAAKIKAEEIVENKKYKKYLISILDILGIKALIYKHRNNDEYIAINIIEKMQRIVKDVINSLDLTFKIDILNISDSFVFICEPSLVRELITMLAIVQFHILLECNQLLRGAVTIGDAIKDDVGKTIIGPAFIRAYLIQEKDSIYPRIIIDNCVKKEVMKKPVLKDFISFDSDRECYLNYLKIFMNITKNDHSDLITMFKREGLFKFLQEKYDEFNKDNEEDHNKKQKYGWTIEYYKNLEVWQSD